MSGLSLNYMMKGLWDRGSPAPGMVEGRVCQPRPAVGRDTDQLQEFFFNNGFQAGILILVYFFVIKHIFFVFQTS